jgi:FKBP-type peptidyl-prolyl cis-trans isomerase FkpA
MSEITAVPLRPVAPGTLTRLWIGVGAAALLAGGLAYAGTSKPAAGMCLATDVGKGLKLVKTPSGLIMQTVKRGQGPMPTEADVVLVDYKGSLRNKTVFDQAQRAPLPLAGMIPGFTEALKMMQVGGNYRFCLPSNLGYGAASPSPKIPANSALIFDVQLLDFRSQAEIQAMQQQLQQQQGAQSPPPMVPGGQ